MENPFKMDDLGYPTIFGNIHMTMEVMTSFFFLKGNEIRGDTYLFAQCFGMGKLIPTNIKDKNNKKSDQITSVQVVLFYTWSRPCGA